MGCSSSTISHELPEKLNWTRPDFDELCSKGENSLKLLNELKHGVLSSWDRVCSKFTLPNVTPDLVYLAILTGFSIEGKGDFMAIDLHLAQTLPGYSKIQIKNPQLAELCFFWEEFCNDLLGAIPKIHSIQEDIIQTACVYHQVMTDRIKHHGENDNLEEEIEEAVQANLKILANGADFFHVILAKVIDWVEKLCNLFSNLDPDRVTKIHSFAKVCEGLTVYSILEKDHQGLLAIMH
ncbi:hypothetical protein SteCoe_24845 [Stentor coeruleus]|uniref:Uncharacterized protein n=1 Tax=Stentor coeruleus TaxID=5963 RepID=A0A1R2BGZ3_9CILI|nr:hypothetical protein SteCoe_24845 [Stentor coeruleus]